MYQVVEAHWPAFRQRSEESGGLPRFVAREFEEFLRCGILEHGLARLECRRCGQAMVVAYSCKRRGWCPSCCGRRMADAAAHLVDEVLPRVPIRQWVCSLPWRWRAAIAFDRGLCSDVLEAFASSLMRLLRWRAKRALGLASVRLAIAGAITFVQRFDSSLRINPHFHTLAPDGVWVTAADGTVQFEPLGEPTGADLELLARWTHDRFEKVLVNRGRLEAGDALASEEPVLASCYAASAQDVQLLGAQPGRKTHKIFGPVRVEAAAAGALVAECGGINVHAGTVIDGRDRRRLERLCRYMGRPPVCGERLEVQPDGRVRYDFKSVWKDGTRAVVLEPLDFLARLAALVPPPRFHMLRYHGAFAGSSKSRQAIVPQSGKQPDVRQLPLSESIAPAVPPPAPAPPRHPWAFLLKRVFAIDVAVCPVPGCNGTMRLVETVRTQEAIARVLADVGLAPRPPTSPDRIPPRQLALPFAP